MSNIDDRIVWNKELRDDANAIAEAITEHLVENNKNSTIGFCLFLVDMRTGTVQYTSDLPHADAVGMLGHWVNQSRQ